MTTIRSIASLVLGTTLLAAPALADVTAWPSAKVSVDSPAGWTSTIKGNEVELAAPKKDIAVAFVTVPTGAVKDAAGVVTRQLGKKLQNMTVKNTKATTINGMKGALVDGTGTLNGTPVVWMVLILDTPAQDVDMMSLTMGADAAISAHKGDLDYIFNHLKPTA